MGMHAPQVLQVAAVTRCQDARASHVAPFAAHHLCSSSQVSLLMTVKSMPSDRPSRSWLPCASSSGELSMAAGRGAMCWIFSGLQTVAGSPLVSRLKLAYSAHLSNHLCQDEDVTHEMHLTNSAHAS